MPVDNGRKENPSNSSMPDAIRVSLIVTGILEDLGVPYLIGGSVASIIHGEPRLTNDIDLVADIKEEQVPLLVAALETDFYIDERAVHRAIRDRNSFNILYLETMYKVDIFIPRGDEWSHEQMQSREGKSLVEGDDLTVRFVSNPETTVLQKLCWFRRGNEVSDRQWRDVLGILKVKAGQLDYDYLKHWAARLAISDLLEKTFDEAGVNPATPQASGVDDD
ncbi:MAG: hypothetical protein J2P21_10040 [Chloracidobacterium sp.]|nr:hypothetical protein [Chloracidobacterium sp.]